MNDSAAVRSRILDALRLDLVGPRPGETGHDAYAEEVLPVAPSKWYLTGFLVPYEAPAQQRADDDSDDTLDQVDRPVEGDDDNASEATSARKAFFPSSMGLSVLVPHDTTELQVRITWANYAPVKGGTKLDQMAEENQTTWPLGRVSENGCAKGGVRMVERQRRGGRACCVRDDSCRRSAPGCGRDESADRAARQSAVRSRRSRSIR